MERSKMTGSARSGYFGQFLDSNRFKPGGGKLAYQEQKESVGKLGTDLLGIAGKHAGEYVGDKLKSFLGLKHGGLHPALMRHKRYNKKSLLL
jgi:hypothetical protein